MHILVVGAGFAGATIARLLAETGLKITTIETQDHVGGNCHTYRDDETGIMVHAHGPHIFHTDKIEPWKFVQRFGDFVPYRHTVRTTYDGRVFSMPINLLTLNQLWQTDLSPNQAKSKIEAAQVNSAASFGNFEAAALNALGHEVFSAFFKGYTEKQWGCSARQIPASVFKRLPIRFDYNDSYFNHDIQAIPRDGYTAVISRMLRHPNITLCLNTEFSKPMLGQFDHVFFTGPIDSFFNFRFGKLSYRSLKFEKFTTDGDYQGCAVMNYSDRSVPFTRITEFKHFTPFETFEKTVYAKEYAIPHRPELTAYYPIRSEQDKATLTKYEELAKQLKNVTFLGRLGSYRYIDMDQAINQAMTIASRFIYSLRYARDQVA